MINSKLKNKELVDLFVKLLEKSAKDSSSDVTDTLCVSQVIRTILEFRI